MTCFKIRGQNVMLEVLFCLNCLKFIKNIDVQNSSYKIIDVESAVKSASHKYFLSSQVLLKFEIF